MKIRQILAIVFAAALVACGGGEKKGGGTADTLVIAFDASPTNLDPRVGTDSYSGRVWDLASSGLIKVTPSGDYAADVATKWETPDSKTIVFHLDPNAKFQDGKPVTAKDFKSTFDSIMAQTFPSPKRSGYAQIASFDAPDDHTFVVKMSEPNAGVLDNFPYMLVPQGADPSVFAKAPILAGPYKVTEYRPDERVTLQAFPQWHGGAPKIQNVIIRIIPDATTRVQELTRGSVNFEINSIPLDSVDPFKRNPNYRVMTAHGGAW